MVYTVTTGEATPFLGTRLKAETSLSGRCVREEQVLRSDDTSDDPRVDAVACRRVNAASMLCVPLFHQGETVGVLKVYSPEAHHFGDGGVETLELLSELIAAQRIAAQIPAAGLGEGEISASFGIATSVDRDSDGLLADADRTLLAAKDRLYGRDPR